MRTSLEPMYPDPPGIPCVLVEPTGRGRFIHRGESLTLEQLPIGAIWDATWKRRKGFDGRAIYVLIPGRYPWFVDGRASNCSKPNDLDHRCWIRHGEPPLLHVDKAGLTCAAGAGSIIAPDGWHGFLSHGYLTTRR